jgi:serine/threonine protein kinase
MDEANLTIAGRYRILRKLGQGGFGSTWLAQGLHSDRNVVIKIMGGGVDERATQFFRQEAQVLARIRNPHVGGILEYGELDDGRPYLVLEYIEGASLARILKRGPLPVEYALVIAEAIADGLSAAHAIGIIHRDIKPSNIIVPEANGVYLFEQTKLLDFGVRGEIRISTGTTQAGQFYGTPQYMSPEQTRAEEQSPSTDVYGLGAVLYEMIYGHPPFSADSFIEIVSKTLREEVIFPESPLITDSVRDLIRRCLSKQSKDRPQNGSALLSEISRVRTALPPADVSWKRYEIATTMSADGPPTLGKPKARPGFEDNRLGKTYARRRVSKLAALSRLILFLTLFLIVALAVGIVSRPTFFGWRGDVSLRRIAWVFVGFILSTAGVGMWFWTRNWLVARRSEIQRTADNILLGRKSLDALTQSLAIEVDAIIARVKQVDERIIAHTLAMMVKEYEGAKESKDRQSALVNAVSILEKLNTKLSPWYVRHDKLVAFVISAVGVISGLVTIVINILKIKKGSP